MEQKKSGVFAKKCFHALNLAKTTLSLLTLRFFVPGRAVWCAVVWLGKVLRVANFMREIKDRLFTFRGVRLNSVECELILPEVFLF